VIIKRYTKDKFQDKKFKGKSKEFKNKKDRKEDLC
jgi:hypothetical protein